MMRILHCADLHLTARDEREYSLSVLDEILGVAADRETDALVFAGDLFDSFADAEALRAQFRERISRLAAACGILFVPGNHEERGIRPGRFAGLDFGPIDLCDEKPFQLIRRGDVEFLCIPHQPDYSAFEQWQVPEKQAKFRIAVAHASVPGLAGYTGMSEEEEVKAGAMDRDIFTFFKADYAALGHIHKKSAGTAGSCALHYPGSARVWRRGEIGERGVNLVSIDESVQVQFLPLRRAGQYRYYDVPLSLDGNVDGLEELTGRWHPADTIEIRLFGLVEDEKDVAVIQEAFLGCRRSGKVREIVIDTSGVVPVPGIASTSIARQFLARWNDSKPSDDDSAGMRRWLKAREMGLKAIQPYVGR